MNQRALPAILCIPLALLASCSKQGPPQVAGPAGTAPPPARELKDETDPALKIESKQELPLGAGTKATIWTLRGTKVKDLTARLLVCTDGKADRNNEITCRWDDPSKPMHGQLVLLVQDGEPFGVKGKCLPSLSLSFQSGPPTSQTTKRISRLIPSDLGTTVRTASEASLISGKEVLYAEASAPVGKGKRTLSLGTEDGLVESSKGGGVALAVIVEWKQ
jgi:hypothetical protein